MHLNDNQLSGLKIFVICVYRRAIRLDGIVPVNLVVVAQSRKWYNPPDYKSRLLKHCQFQIK